MPTLEFPSVENEFFAVERPPRRARMRWRFPALLALITVFCVLYARFGAQTVQLSGNYQGFLEDPAVGKTGLRLHLQQIGDQVVGNCTLSRVYGYQQTTRQMNCTGVVSGSTLKLRARGNAQDGTLVLTAQAGQLVGAEFKLLGHGHFEGGRESNQDVPLMLRKVITFI